MNLAIYHSKLVGNDFRETQLQPTLRFEFYPIF